MLFISGSGHVQGSDTPTIAPAGHPSATGFAEFWQDYLKAIDRWDETANDGRLELMRRVCDPHAT